MKLPPTLTTPTHIVLHYSEVFSVDPQITDGYVRRARVQLLPPVAPSKAIPGQYPWIVENRLGNKPSILDGGFSLTKKLALQQAQEAMCAILEMPLIEDNNSFAATTTLTFMFLGHFNLQLTRAFLRLGNQWQSGLIFQCVLGGWKTLDPLDPDINGTIHEYHKYLREVSSMNEAIEDLLSDRLSGSLSVVFPEELIPHLQPLWVNGEPQ